MNWYFFIYTSFFIVAILHELIRKKNTLVDALTFFNVFFIIKYLTPAILWSWYPNDVLWQSYSVSYNGAMQPIVCFFLIMTYSLVIFSFYISMYLKSNYLLGIVIRGGRESFYKAHLIFCLLACFVVLIAVFVDGGLTSYLQKGIYSRYYSSQGGFSDYIKYFLYPISIWFVGLLAIRIDKYFDNKIILNLIIISTCTAMLIFTLSLGGRAAIIYIILNVLFYLLIYNDKITLNHLILSVVIGVMVAFIMSYYREISFIFLGGDEVSLDSLDGDGGLIYSVLSIFSYYKHYFYTINEYVNNPEGYEYPRLGLDTIRAFISLVPGVGSGGDLDLFWLSSNVSELNQSILGGYSGYIPPGWIGMALIDGGVIWLVVKSIFIGFSSSFINKSIINFDKGCAVSMYFYFLIIVYWNYFLFLQEPFSVAQQSLGYYFYLFFLLPFINFNLMKK